MKGIFIRKGFTLIEILLVISIIAILASVVLLALNPSKQFNAAQDRSRFNDADKLQKALAQYQIDFGVLPKESQIPLISETPKPICAFGKSASTCMNFDSELVSAYLVTIPRDPAEVDANYSGYKVAKGNPQPIVESTNFNHSIFTLDAGLVGEWNFETPGTTAYDASLNGNDGTYAGSPSLNISVPKTTFTNKKSLNLNGTSQYVTMPNSASLQIATGTLSAWINTSNAGAGFRGIVVKQMAFGMFLLDNVFVLYDWSANVTITTGVSLNDGRWHHVALAFRSGVANGTTFYIDGQPVAVTNFTVANQTVAPTIAANGTVQYFTGLIDNARIYNRVLSAAEIAALAKGEG